MLCISLVSVVHNSKTITRWPPFGTFSYFTGLYSDEPDDSESGSPKQDKVINCQP